MFNLMIILLSTLNGEPKDSNNYRIAKYIIEHIHEMENCTLSQLAEKCYVSNSSISRFCRDIGLGDFNELRTQLARFPLSYLQAKDKFNFREFDEQSISRSFILSIIDNLEAFMKSDDLDAKIDKLTDEILSYPNVAAFGYMNSENVALDLQYNLQTNSKPLFTSIKFINQIEYIASADENTLIIIFSESGSYFNRAFKRENPFHTIGKKPRIWMITADKQPHQAYIDEYLIYNSRKDFASHPYPLEIIADLIAISFARKKQAIKQ